MRLVRDATEPMELNSLPLFVGATTPPGGGATRVGADTVTAREGDDDGRATLLGEEAGSNIEPPLAPEGGDTRVPSLPELPVEPAEPADPDDPDELDEPAVPLDVRGPACAHTVAGTDNVNTIAIDPKARMDLVMASAPEGS